MPLLDHLLGLRVEIRATANGAGDIRVFGSVARTCARCHDGARIPAIRALWAAVDVYADAHAAVRDATVATGPFD